MRSTHTSPIPDETRESTESTEEFFLDPEAEKSSLRRTQSQPDARRKTDSCVLMGKVCFGRDFFSKKKNNKKYFLWDDCKYVCVCECVDKKGKILQIPLTFLHQKARRFFLSSIKCLVARA